MIHDRSTLTIPLTTLLLGLLCILVGAIDMWTGIGDAPTTFLAICAIAAFACVLATKSVPPIAIGLGTLLGLLSAGVASYASTGLTASDVALFLLIAVGALIALTTTNPPAVAMAPIAFSILAAGGTPLVVGMAMGLAAVAILQTAPAPSADFLSDVSVATPKPFITQPPPEPELQAVTQPQQPVAPPTPAALTPPPAAVAPAPARSTAVVVDDGHFYPTLGQGSRGDGRVGQLISAKLPFAAGSESDEYAIADLRLVAHSKRGTSHSHGGDYRQDNYALSKTDDDRFAIIAVSDGLGSATASHIGSYWASRLTATLLTSELTRTQPSQAMFAELLPRVCTSMSKIAATLGASNSNDIASTLVVCIAPTNGQGPVHFGRVGDSDVLLLREGSWQSAFQQDTDSPIESGATSALPLEPNALEHTTAQWSDFTCALIATDGVSRVIENAPKDVGMPFAEQLSSPCSSLEFQSLVGFRRRGAHDDRTAVAIWNMPEQNPSPGRARSS